MAFYLFFDESGNLDFSPNGTPFYHFGVLSTRDPVRLTQALLSLKYTVLSEGMETEYFHATEDRQVIRDRVFQAIVQCGGFDFDCVIAEKAKTHPSLYDEAQFYPKFAAYLLEYVFNRHPDPSERVVVITDRLPVKKHRAAVEKAFKTFIRQHLKSRPFSILHHTSAGHPCLQAADYCMWAVHKKWKDNDRRSYDLVHPFIRSEFDIFRTGVKYFYGPKKNMP